MIKLTHCDDTEKRNMKYCSVKLLLIWCVESTEHFVSSLKYQGKIIGRMMGSLRLINHILNARLSGLPYKSETVTKNKESKQQNKQLGKHKRKVSKKNFV